MAKSIKHPKTEPAEIPLEPKPKRRRKQDEIRELKDALPVVTADEMPSFVHRHRPDGPRKRADGELRNYFASKELRLGVDDSTNIHQMEVVKGELTGDQKDYIARHGVHPVDDEEKFWNGKQSEINRADGDMNLVGFRVGKGEGKGR